MNYLTWIKSEYARWNALARSAPPDHPFVNLAASGMVGAGDGILASYPHHLDLASPSAPWRADPDLNWGHATLRRRLAELYQLPSPDQVLPTAGGSQALYLALSALRHHLRTPTATLDSPNYAPLYEIPRALGFDLFPTSPFPTSPSPALHLLSNPNNPTGAFFPPSEICSLLSSSPPTTYLLVDESFLSPAEGGLSSATLHNPRIITLGGLTKPLGLGSLRTGWIIAHGPTLPLLRDTWTQCFNIGSPLTESLAAAILRDIDQHHTPLAARLATNLHLLTTEFLDPLTTNGLITCPPPTHGAIAFPQILPLTHTADPRAAMEAFYNCLLDHHHLATVPGAWFSPNPTAATLSSLRLSFGQDTDTLRQGLSRLRRALEAL